MFSDKMKRAICIVLAALMVVSVGAVAITVLFG
jgi:hypothetical protein